MSRDNLTLLLLFRTGTARPAIPISMLAKFGSACLLRDYGRLASTPGLLVELT